MLSPILIFLTIFGIVDSKYSGRILNGLNTEQNEFPFIVSIRHNRVQHHCGGSIITSKHILTAAHCLTAGNDPKNYTIYIGSNKLTNGIPKNVESIIAHENYTGEFDWWKHDLAIIKLVEPLVYSPSVQEVKISQNVVYDGEILTVAGWGKTMVPTFSFPNIQQKVSIVAVSNEKCVFLWPSLVNGQLCLWNGPKSQKGFCSGDSGGPILNSKQELVGIVSWNRVNCDQQKPDVAVKLAPYYLQWIQNNIN